MESRCHDERCDGTRGRSDSKHTQTGGWASRRGITLLLLAGVLLCTAPAWGDTQVIPVLIRDLSDAHPDFELPESPWPYGLDQGFVSSTLGGDGTPTYIGGGSGSSTSGATNFFDWYHDTAATAGKTVVNLSLDNGLAGSGGVYVYDNQAFFPIDGALGGNEGRPHNQHFTMEMHTTFTYEVGQTFSFNGDDDLFVFIDGNLVIDLGGVHLPESASVDLGTLGLTEGDDYAFDLFYAERHTSHSVLHMETGIQFVAETGDLTIVKFRDGDEDGDFDQGSEPTLPGWDFRITNDGGFSQDVTTGPDGSVTINLEIGEYDIEEINIPLGWTTTTPNPLADVLVTSSGETVFFGNIPEPTTMAVLAIGGIGALVRRKRRQA
jgi:fibro-slime domain-containing protein